MAIVRTPVLKQTGGGATYIVQVSAVTPGLHTLANAVDHSVFLNAIGSPFVKCMLASATGFARARNGDEIGTWPPERGDIVGDAGLVKFEVPRRLFKWRIDDRIFYDHLFHEISPVTGPGALAPAMPGRLTEAAIGCQLRRRRGGMKTWLQVIPCDSLNIGGQRQRGRGFG